MILGRYSFLYLYCQVLSIAADLDCSYGAAMSSSGRSKDKQPPQGPTHITSIRDCYLLNRYLRVGEHNTRCRVVGDY